jgi:hypothetical protein
MADVSLEQSKIHPVLVIISNRSLGKEKIPLPNVPRPRQLNLSKLVFAVTEFATALGQSLASILNLLPPMKKRISQMIQIS